MSPMMAVASACSVEIYFDRGFIAVDPIDAGRMPARKGVVVPFHPHASGVDASLKRGRNRRVGDHCGMSAVEQRSSKIDQFSPVRDHETTSARLNFSTRNIFGLQMVPARCVTGCFVPVTGCRAWQGRRSICAGPDCPICKSQIGLLRTSMWLCGKFRPKRSRGHDWVGLNLPPWPTAAIPTEAMVPAEPSASSSSRIRLRPHVRFACPIRLSQPDARCEPKLDQTHQSDPTDSGASTGCRALETTGARPSEPPLDSSKRSVCRPDEEFIQGLDQIL